MRHERDYIDRTIETVRLHQKENENCWPQWANIFADNIEDHRALLLRLRHILENIADPYNPDRRKLIWAEECLVMIREVLA